MTASAWCFGKVDKPSSPVRSCTRCEYTSNAEKTEAPPLPAVDHGPAFLLKRDHFATPGIVNMEEQARAFRDAEHDGLPLHQASKFYLLRVTNLEVTRTVGLVLRGDHEPNLVKLRNLMGSDAVELLPLEEAEALAGCRSGFIGPVDLALPMYVDSSLADAVNLTCGANRTDHHHFGFSPRRDLEAPTFADLRMAQAGDACPRCGQGTFEAFRGIEVGQVFRLGTKYSRAMACVFLDEHGQEQPSIGITRTIAAVIEQNHDADGIIWPWPVAPYHVHLLNLDPANPEVNDVAHRLEEELEAAGFDVLHDDREGLSPGVKFKDADLLGFPLRAMVGSRSLKSDVVELRDRRTKDLRKFKPDEMVAEVTAARDRILRDLASSAS